MKVGFIRVPLAQRFWNKVTKTNGCWLWTGAVNSSGYGSIKVDGKTKTAHRVAYELQYGEIPDGVVIDHICENKLCVLHLECVTSSENTQRWLNNHPRSFCRRGLHQDVHAMGVNKNGSKYCKLCHSTYTKNYYRRNK